MTWRFAACPTQHRGPGAEATAPGLAGAQPTRTLTDSTMIPLIWTALASVLVLLRDARPSVDALLEASHQIARAARRFGSVRPRSRAQNNAARTARCHSLSSASADSRGIMGAKCGNCLRTNEFRRISPHSTGDSSQSCCAEGRGLDHVRPLDGNSQSCPTETGVASCWPTHRRRRAAIRSSPCRASPSP